MRVYINVYEALPLSRGEPCVRIYHSLEQALKAQYSDCIGTFMINTETKEARVIPSPDGLDTNRPVEI